MACCASNHRSKGARLLALAAFAAACGERAPDTRTVTLHVPSACPADGAAYGTFHALGDFDAPGPTTGHLLGHAGEGLPEIGAAARAILVEATEDGRD
ncbi:MAG TPA: hypothetical protein VE987_17775, partial [Polyangiaceae bacterium]|nr:hypothetical protein [Polyangiaceae bacterium]